MTPALLEKLAPGVRWHDDWYAIETIAPGIHAIGEPRYHQINWSYLIEGADAALMFDTGPGLRDIRPVAESLTRHPIIAMPSHLHFDHTGNLHRFNRIAMADLPILRRCESDGWFHAPEDLYLGSWEDMTWKPVKITDWLLIGSTIELGNRSLDVIHTPGHSPDSVSLLERASNTLFAADFIYPGALYAQVPGANLADYLRSAEALLPRLDPQAAVYCGHGRSSEQGCHAAPRLERNDIADLADALKALKSSGNRPGRTLINSRMTLLANDAAFSAWQSLK
jgi:glyoxylase-like metal-dependent hydrolase (beta-lactamase superfamily II)